MDEEEDIDSGTLASFFGDSVLGPISPEGQTEALRILKQYNDYEESDARPEDELIDQMKANSEKVRKALVAARERLVNERYNPGEALLAVSSALGRPTRFGTIGEVAGNVSESLRDPIARRRQFERERDTALTNLDVQEAGLNDNVISAQFALEKLNRQLRAQMAGRALTSLRGTGRSGAVQREAKIRDTMSQLISMGIDPMKAYNRATNIVDGREKMEVVPQLGVVRFTDIVNKTAEEIPIQRATGPAGGARGTSPVRPGATGETRETPQTPPPVAAGQTPLGEPSEDPRDVASPNRLTMWDASSKGTGFWSALGAGYNAFAGNVGLPIADEVERARQSIREGAQRMLRSLSVDPNDPSAREMDRIREEINVLPTIAGNPKVMQERLRVIDADLRDLYRRAMIDKDDTSLGIDFRKSRETLAAEIRNFIPNLGVPPEGSQGRPVPLGVPKEVEDLWPYMTPEAQDLAERLYGNK